MDKATKRYFVIDLLCWDNSHFVDTEFMYRLSFLQARFAAMPELSTTSRGLAGGGYSFHLQPTCICSAEKMAELMKINFKYELDGLLFYYSRVYTLFVV